MDLAISELAALQHGTVALRQLMALGFSARGVRKRVERSRLQRVHRGVYSLSPVLTDEGRLMAAVLACGDGATLSHRSAAHHLGIRRTSRPQIEISVPRGRRAAQRGIQAHVMRAKETTVLDGIPCTTLPQTLLDLAEVLPPFHVRKAITRAEQLRIFDLTDVQRILANANGRRGAPILAALLADFEPVETETKIEDLFFALCPIRPESQYRVGGYRADFAWPAQRLIAEVDGWETHGTRTAFEKDRERLQELMANGWRVVMFTYRQITEDPERVRRILNELLRSWPAPAAATAARSRPAGLP